MNAPPVGLYSIGIRSLDAGELILVASTANVPFIHLRGGPKGYDLARVPPPQIDAWARQARHAAPITVVTADTDASAFLSAQDGHHPQASAELDALATAAARLGAQSVRLLSRVVPSPAQRSTPSLPDLRASHGLLTLIELHDPAWFDPDAIDWLYALLDRSPGVALLLDSHQVHAAWELDPHPGWPGVLEGLARRARVAHLSDPGTGLEGAGHRLTAHALLTAASDGRRIEVAFEWTGPDRSPATCLARYRDAADWWNHMWARYP